MQAYREFRRENFSTKWPYYLRPEVWARLIRDLLIPNGYSKDDNRRVKNIRFVGLWDSVAAYGLPIDEMTRGVSQWIWPWQLPNCVLNERVQRACHALSIDDERTTFHPILWDERNEAPLQPEADGSRLIEKERISQVWFAGVHSNVGGGYPGRLARANSADLDDERGTASGPPVQGDRQIQPANARSCHHRARQGRPHLQSPLGARRVLSVWAARPHRPRQGSACAQNPEKGKPPIPQPPKIHESVLHRIGNNAHLYAPIGLPGRYDVVTVTGKVVEQPKFERLDQANSRIARQAKIWNLIWWRRLFYFATVGVTLWLLAFPFMGASRAADEFMSPLRWVSDIVRTLGSILPSFATPWINGWARAPGHFLLTVLVLAAMLLYSGRLARRTGNDMAVAWRASLDNDLGKVAPPTDWLYRLRTSAGYIKLHDVRAKDHRARAVCDPVRLSRRDLDQPRAL